MMSQLFETTHTPARARSKEYERFIKYRRILRIFGESIELAQIIGRAAAERQLSKGVLGQSGTIGMGGWTPENIGLEMDQLYVKYF